MENYFSNEILSEQGLTENYSRLRKQKKNCGCQKCTEQHTTEFSAPAYEYDLAPSLLGEIFLESEGSPVSAKKRVRTFYCNTADHKNVKKILPAATVPQLRAIVEETAATVISWIYNAIGKLRVSPRSASAISVFKQAFVQAPNWNPAWKTAAMKWIDWGDLIATKLEKAAKIIDGGWIKYNCSESTTYCPECKGIATYWACSSFKGKYIICLGTDFWKAHSAGDKDGMATTLLHEALHIYFGKNVAHDGRSKNAYCYEQFLLAINGKVVPKIVSDCCPKCP